MRPLYTAVPELSCAAAAAVSTRFAAAKNGARSRSSTRHERSGLLPALVLECRADTGCPSPSTWLGRRPSGGVNIDGGQLDWTCSDLLRSAGCKWSAGGFRQQTSKRRCACASLPSPACAGGEKVRGQTPLRCVCEHRAGPANRKGTGRRRRAMGHSRESASHFNGRPGFPFIGRPARLFYYDGSPRGFGPFALNQARARASWPANGCRRLSPGRGGSFFLSF